MHFNLVDAVIERSDRRIVTIKQVSAAEEYLQDHFPGFPVLPGVLMVESIVQAARLLLEPLAPGTRMVLGTVRALKYGQFIRPGDALRVEVTIAKELPDGAYELKAEGTAIRNSYSSTRATPENPTQTTPAPASETVRTAVAGKITLRPVRLGEPR